MFILFWILWWPIYTINKTRYASEVWLQNYLYKDKITNKNLLFNLISYICRFKKQNHIEMADFTMYVGRQDISPYDYWRKLHISEYTSYILRSTVHKRKALFCQFCLMPANRCFRKSCSGFAVMQHRSCWHLSMKANEHMEKHNKQGGREVIP